MFGLAIVLILVVIAAIAAIAPPAKDGFGGPYNIGLYDSPYYYPFYQGRDYTAAWDSGGRCATYCRADGCAVVCR